MNGVTLRSFAKYGKKTSNYIKWSSLLLTFSLFAMLLANPSMSIYAFEQYKFVLKWGSFGAGDSQFMLPHDIAIDSKGNVYISGRDNNNIQKFTHNGTFILSIGIDPSDHVFVVDRENSRIGEFDENGTFINKWYGVSSTDNDTGNNRVLKVDDKFNLITKWGTKGTGNGQFIHPHAIDVDSKGNVYVGTLMKPGVQIFDSNETFITKWGKSGTAPGQFSVPQKHIAIDKNDYIYIVDGASNPRVQKFFTNGTLVGIVGMKGSADGQLMKPEHVSIDSQGNLFVVDRGNARIQVFNL